MERIISILIFCAVTGRALSYDNNNVYSLVSAGNCEENGLESVYEKNECVAALNTLNYGTVDGLISDVRDIVDGCTLISNKGQIFMSINEPGTCDIQKYPEFCTGCDETFRCVCREKIIRASNRDSVLDSFQTIKPSVHVTVDPTSAPTESVYVFVTNGACEDSGLNPILDIDQCKQALDYLGYENMGYEKEYSDFIDGCTILKGRAFGFLNARGSCNISMFPRFCNNCGEDYPCVCKKGKPLDHALSALNNAEPFMQITNGVCENYSYFPIFDPTACEKALEHQIRKTSN